MEAILCSKDRSLSLWCQNIIGFGRYTVSGMAKSRLDLPLSVDEIRGKVVQGSAIIAGVRTACGYKYSTIPDAARRNLLYC